MNGGLIPCPPWQKKPLNNFSLANRQSLIFVHMLHILQDGFVDDNADTFLKEAACDEDIQHGMQTTPSLPLLHVRPSSDRHEIS